MSLLNVVVDLYHSDTVDPDSGFHDLKTAGILGVIHKSSQGMGSVDPEYDHRRVRALSVGLYWGSYHFGTRGDGAAQADHYLGIVNPTENELLVLDYEPNGEAGTMTLSQAEAFVKRVHEETGSFPVLYSGESFLREKVGSRTTVLTNCPLWIARYGPNQPRVPAAFANLGKTFAMWQYTDGAEGLQPHSVPGVGRCDRNKFNGTLDQLKQFWNQ